MDVAKCRNKKADTVATDLGSESQMHEFFNMNAGADRVETGDILIRRMQYHAKQAWMLRSPMHRVDDTVHAASS